MNKQILELLKSKNVVLEKGLSAKEFNHIKSIYNIEFPIPLKDLLGNILPVSKGFYNWRNFNEKNIKFIKACMEFPIKNICNLANEVDWCDEWGMEPEDEKIRDNEIRKRTLKAPKLIPVYSHRYMPLGQFNSYPILSISGVDVIYYGKDLDDYIRIEFGDKKQSELDYKIIQKVPFWTDLM